MRICCLQTVLLSVVQLFLSCCTLAAPSVQNNFFYQDILRANGKKEIYFSDVRLHVDSAQPSVFAARGGNATLPCRFWYELKPSSPREARIKWSWLPASGRHEEDVLLLYLSVGCRLLASGRVELRQDFPGDAALVMTDLQLNDTGRYRCEVVDGLEDKSTTVHLELQDVVRVAMSQESQTAVFEDHCPAGVVFPYQHHRGRYHLSFLGARRACEEQDSTLATFTQLFQSWKEGLNWCNAGWLADGTVQYPITQPRVPCGGHGLAPGVRSYGRRHLNLHRYDVFCFSSSIKGKVYYLEPSQKMNLTESQQACQEDGAEIAKVGQLYAAWKFAGVDRCDAGWLADGSVRYPIGRPRRNCGPPEPGVRSFGFPPLQHKHGVYCYKLDGE